LRGHPAEKLPPLPVMGHLFVLNRFIISLNNDPEYVEINSTQYTHAMPNMENIVTKSTISTIMLVKLQAKDRHTPHKLPTH
jgi:hypothetical protein